MKWANRVTITALSKDEPELTKEAVIALVGENPVKISKVQGFNEQMITKFEVIIKKASSINQFFKMFFSKLKKQQLEVLISQIESRLDERHNLFIRIDKEAWIEERKLFLTDSGDCFHIRISLAVFPSKSEIAAAKSKELLESFL